MNLPSGVIRGFPGPQSGFGSDLAKFVSKVSGVDWLDIRRGQHQSAVFPVRSGRQVFGGPGGPVMPERSDQVVGDGQGSTALGGFQVAEHETLSGPALQLSAHGENWWRGIEVHVIP